MQLIYAAVNNIVKYVALVPVPPPHVLEYATDGGAAPVNHCPLNPVDDVTPFCPVSFETVPALAVEAFDATHRPQASSSVRHVTRNTMVPILGALVIFVNVPSLFRV